MAGKKTNCGKCKKDIGRNLSAQCDECLEKLHLACAGVDEAFCILKSKNNGISFICVNCKNCSTSNSSLRNEIDILNKKMDNMFEGMSQQNNSIDKKLEDIVIKLKSEFFSKFEKIEEELKRCQQAKELDSDMEYKMRKLEIDNNTLHHRLNRTDVVINGLPNKIDCLEDTIIKLCLVFNITINASDIQHACFMNGNKSVLVKFCRVRIRDCLMGEYHKTRSLKLSDIDGSDIHSRVFLNDHFTPLSARMNFVCKQLLNKKKIKKYKIYNADKPKVSILNTDGTNVMLSFEECEKLL